MAIRFVLSNPNVHTVLYTLQNYSEAHEFLKLSGSRLTSRDKDLLASYSRECGSLYCRNACGLCEYACSHQVPVNTIMRYDHYFVAQGREKHAMAEYAALRSTKADVCQSCAGYCGSAWHLVPLVQADRSPSWIAWQCLNIAATRVLLVWIYNNTGKSAFAAAVCHATLNVSWLLFPSYGSHYDPRIIGPITAFAAVLVTVIWGPQTLSRNRKVPDGLIN